MVELPKESILVIGDFFLAALSDRTPKVSVADGLGIVSWSIVVASMGCRDDVLLSDATPRGREMLNPGVARAPQPRSSSSSSSHRNHLQRRGQRATHTQLNYWITVPVYLAIYFCDVENSPVLSLSHT